MTGSETVTPLPEREADSQMSVVGLLVAAGSALALLPVLPVVAILGLLEREQEGGGDGDHAAE